MGLVQGESLCLGSTFSSSLTLAPFASSIHQIFGALKVSALPRFLISSNCSTRSSSFREDYPKYNVVPFSKPFPLEVFEAIIQSADRQALSRTARTSFACYQLFMPGLLGRGGPVIRPDRDEVSFFLGDWVGQKMYCMFSSPRCEADQS